jgi:hypothetical protein
MPELVSDDKAPPRLVVDSFTYANAATVSGSHKSSFGRF